MHFGLGAVSNWPKALAYLPPLNASVKSLEDFGLLREAKQSWAASGRLLKNLHTVFRPMNYDYIRQPTDNFQGEKEYWRMEFAKSIDGASAQNFFEPGFVDFVQEKNEYVGTGELGTDILRRYLVSVQAAVAVWNSEFRGKVLTAHTGEQGRIPDNVRLAIGAVPVGNDFDISWFKLAAESDSGLAYNGYVHASLRDFAANGGRDPGDWQYHSGRVFHQEAQFGIKPPYILITEGGPYMGADEGWRHSICLNGDEAALFRIMGEYYRDLGQTAAWKEGRVVGQGAWFTSGGGRWDYFQMEESQLIGLAKAATDNLPPIALHEGPLPAPQPVPEPAPARRVELLGNLILRDAPAATANRITALYKGTVLPLQEARMGWYRVTDTGWISGGQYARVF